MCKKYANYFVGILGSDIFVSKLHNEILSMENQEKMYCYKYPHPAVATDCVLFGFDGEGLNVLLIQRGVEPYKGRWAFPGGFMQMDETAEECVVRELSEETGLKGIFVKQFGVFSEVERDPRERVVSIAFYALVRKTEYNLLAGDDAARVCWFPINNVPALAFDHDRILRVALDCLRRNMHFEPMGFRLLDEKFTMTQLQTIYESILGVQFDRRNFSKKMLALGCLRPLGERQVGGAHRAPELYSFDKEAYERLKQKGLKLEF